MASVVYRTSRAPRQTRPNSRNSYRNRRIVNSEFISTEKKPPAFRFAGEPLSYRGLGAAAGSHLTLRCMVRSDIGLTGIDVNSDGQIDSMAYRAFC